MTIGEIIVALLSGKYLPDDMGSKVVDLDASVLISDGDAPRMLRVKAGGTAFVDLWMKDGQVDSFAALGTGASGRDWPGEFDSLASTYPEEFTRGAISVSPVTDAGFLDRLATWRDKRLVDLAAPAGRSGIRGQVGWRILQSRPRAAATDPGEFGLSNWCVPDSMSILTEGLYRNPRTPRYFAQRWGQAEGDVFDEEGVVEILGKIRSRYEHLSDEVASVAKLQITLPWDGTSHLLSYSDIYDLGKLTMVVQEKHAEIFKGAGKLTKTGQVVLEFYMVTAPTLFGDVVRAFVSPYSLRFAVSRN